jgi:hypothetical protein
MGLQAVVGLLLLGGACANQYDVLYPNYLPPVECAHGCAKWSDVQSDGLPFNQSLVDKLFANGTAPKEAGSSCLWPGMAPVHGEGRRMLTADEGWLWEAATPRPGASSIPYCLCKPAPGQNSTLKPPVTPAGQCLPPMSVPEQINLQYASNEITVAGFVTYEAVLPADPPIAMFAEKGATMRSLTGISHWYNSSKFGAMRNYTMSFVKFAGLKPSTVYQYKVKSGADGAAWSEVFEFRSLREAPDTKFGIYGDMGISPYNNMQNLLTDCQSGKIDVFVHMGDHCYDLQMEDDRKGDAYMNSMQPLTATCPWVPIIGNHEGSDIGRYDSQTWGEVYGNPLNGSTSTATSALGHVLSKGTMLGAGMHGTTPSGSSNFFSVRRRTPLPVRSTLHMNVWRVLQGGLCLHAGRYRAGPHRRALHHQPQRCGARLAREGPERSQRQPRQGPVGLGVLALPNLSVLQLLAGGERSLLRGLLPR